MQDPRADLPTVLHVGAGVIQCFGYLVVSLVLGFATYMSAMWGLYGAPVYTVDYIGFWGAVGLFVAALVSLGSARRGRVLALVALAAMGTFWVPATVGLIPERGDAFSLVPWLVVGLYFGGVVFALFFPTRRRWSLPVLAALFVVVASINVSAIAWRHQNGDYDVPSYSFYRWHPGGNSLTVNYDVEGWCDADTQRTLEKAGIRGTLEWMRSSGDSKKHVVVVLVQGPPTIAWDLHYPKGREVIYAYDGVRWQMLPGDAAVYPDFATLGPEDGETFLEQDVGGGREGERAFDW